MIVLKNGQSLEELKKKLEKASEKKNMGINTSKYSDTIKTDIDHLRYQMKTRDDWK